jgi:hypothetical protein
MLLKLWSAEECAVFAYPYMYSTQSTVSSFWLWMLKSVLPFDRRKIASEKCSYIDSDTTAFIPAFYSIFQICSHTVA